MGTLTLQEWASDARQKPFAQRPSRSRQCSPATQYLEEADRLADRIAVIDAGRIVAEGSPEELKLRVAGPRLRITFADGRALERAAAILGDRIVRRDQWRLELEVSTGGDAAEIRDVLDETDPGRDQVVSFELTRPSLDVLDETDPGRDQVVSFELTRPSLDDVFLALTGHASHGKDAIHV